MASILGIDVAKASLSAHLVHGRKARSRDFTNDPAGFAKLLEWLNREEIGELRACMEATSVYHNEVGRVLYEAGYIVHVANPLPVHHYLKSVMRRTKTDKEDAKAIARYCEANPDLHPWKPLSPERQELLRLTRHQESLKTRLARLKNQSGTESSMLILASFERQIAFLTDEIKENERAIQTHIGAHANLKSDYDNIKEIPGFGPHVSSTVLAELKDYERFDNVRQVGSYAGLTSRARESGSSVHGVVTLSKVGNRRLRTALYWAAMYVYRSKSLYGEFTERMLGEGRPKMTIIAALMRKLLCLAYGVLRSGEAYRPDYEADRRSRVA